MLRVAGRTIDPACLFLYSLIRVSSPVLKSAQKFVNFQVIPLIF